MRGRKGSRTRHPGLARPFPGTRSLTRPLTIEERVAAYAPRLPSHGFFSHTTAAALWGLPLPAFADPRLHVSYPHGRRAVRTAGVVGHHLVMRDEELTVLDGIPVTTPERTWCDLAGLVDFEALVAAGDRVVWHRDRLASMDAIAATLRRSLSFASVSFAPAFPGLSSTSTCSMSAETSSVARTWPFRTTENSSTTKATGIAPVGANGSATWRASHDSRQSAGTRLGRRVPTSLGALVA